MIGSPEKSMTKQKLEEQASNAIFYFFIQHDIKQASDAGVSQKRLDVKI